MATAAMSTTPAATVHVRIGRIIVADSMAFEGFPRRALRFLREVGENNNREWFQAHRDDYETLLLEPARDFVVEMGEELRAIGADVHADPRVNGSIFRINRDTRFSKDKRPYKDHLDLWFWEGSGRSRDCPGYWFRLTSEQLILGAGKHHFGDRLGAYRDAVSDRKRGEALRRAVDAVTSTGNDVGGRHYKRVPTGYDVPSDREDLLLHDGLYAYADLAVPAQAHTEEFPRFCSERWRALKPVQDWLVRELG
jgi:uncharacterized protein (TIGR02453 family)